MNITEDVLCPITHELLNDPIVIPCCNVAFSRASLIHSFQKYNNNCPLCRQSNPTFDPTTASKNRTIEKIVNSIKSTTQIANTRVNSVAIDEGASECNESCTTDNHNAFIENVIEYLNKKINIDVFVLKFSTYDIKIKEKIIDNIIFSGMYYGLREEDIMKILENFYNGYNLFTVNFEQNFNKFLNDNSNNTDQLLRFANFLIIFCKKQIDFIVISSIDPTYYLNKQRMYEYYCYSCDKYVSDDKVGQVISHPVAGQCRRSYVPQTIDHCPSCGYTSVTTHVGSTNCIRNVINYKFEKRLKKKQH